MIYHWFTIGITLEIWEIFVDSGEKNICDTQIGELNDWMDRFPQLTVKRNP